MSDYDQEFSLHTVDKDIKISLGGWSEFKGDDHSSPFLLRALRFRYNYLIYL